MEILDIVVNPSGGSDSDDKLPEQELKVADSLVPRELKLICNAIGSERSVLFTWLKLHLLVMFVYFAFFGQELGDSTLFGRVTPWTPHGYAPNGLGQMKYACESAAFLSMFLPLQALRHAVAQGGKLEQLGAGTKKISTTDAANLRRWRIGLMAPLGMVVPMAVFLLVMILPATIIELVTGDCPYGPSCDNPFFIDGEFDSERFGRRIKFIISPVSKAHDHSAPHCTTSEIEVLLPTVGAGGACGPATVLWIPLFYAHRRRASTQRYRNSHRCNEAGYPNRRGAVEQ